MAPLGSHYVVSGIGPDGQGLVAAVTRTLFERACNIEAARMATLGRHFSMTLVISTSTAETELLSALASLRGTHGLTTTLTRLQGYGRRFVRSGTHVVEVTTRDDSPGVVSVISHMLAAHDANIVDLHTTASPERSCTTMTVWLPKGLDPARFEGLLEQALADARGRATRSIRVYAISSAAPDR